MEGWHVEGLEHDLGCLVCVLGHAAERGRQHYGMVLRVHMQVPMWQILACKRVVCIGRSLMPTTQASAKLGSWGALYLKKLCCQNSSKASQSVTYEHAS